MPINPIHQPWIQRIFELRASQRITQDGQRLRREGADE